MFPVRVIPGLVTGGGALTSSALIARSRRTAAVSNTNRLFQSTGATTRARSPTAWTSRFETGDARAVVAAATRKTDASDNAGGRHLQGEDGASSVWERGMEEQQDDLLRSATPPSATFIRDASGHSEMVFDVQLPAIDMGITFRDTGAKGPAVVESLKPGGAAEATKMIEPGDVLVRCTATVLQDSDVLLTMGDGPSPKTKHRQIDFGCLDKDFDTVMAAVNSTGIVDSGIKHSKVRLEFMRDVTGDVERAYGAPRPHPVSRADPVDAFGQTGVKWNRGVTRADRRTAWTQPSGEDD